jgi:uncharacterized protein YheU (UPF0270 family)
MQGRDINLTAVPKSGSIAYRPAEGSLKVRALHDETSYIPDGQEEPVSIPHTELSADALRGVIESFVLREGTDYGMQDFSLEQKVAHVMRQLERGEVRVMFDPNSESVDIQVVTVAKRRS